MTTANPTQKTPSDFHPDEWQARVQLAACYRIFAMWGWTELIYNHITVRLPASVAGDDKQFLINPYGLHYSEVKASNLVKLNVQGQVIGHSDWPVNPAGFTVHAAIHDKLPGAHCVMHTHTTTGMAVASLDAGLSGNNFYAAQLHEQVAYHEFEGVTVHGEEGPRLLKSIGDKQAVILRNHGLLAWGQTLPQTLLTLWTLQRACDIQVATLSMGAERPISVPVRAKAAADALQFDNRFGTAGLDVFNALVRQIDRIDDSYKN